jgi:hypothetical protein
MQEADRTATGSTNVPDTVVHAECATAQKYGTSLLKAKGTGFTPVPLAPIALFGTP